MDPILLSIESFYGELTGGANWSGVWLPFVMLAVMVALILNSILLMFGKAFSIRELETFAKSELLQTIATAFMALFLVVMVGSAMELSAQFITLFL